MKVAAAIAIIIAAVLIACSSELTAPPTQPANATAPTANPTATTVTTEVPVEKTDSEATPSPALEPTATARAAPTPEPTTAATDAPETPTATPVPTPTELHTSEIKLLKVAVAEIPAELPAYDRDDWNHWTASDDDCQDASQEVLVAESRSTVSYRTDRGCRVAAGQWLAPYTSPVVTDPSKLDVNRMVPLDNAHDSRAWQWTAKRCEQYANHLADPQHLIAVTASANRSKGPRGPEDWRPQNPSCWCQYANDWITIKTAWPSRSRKVNTKHWPRCSTPVVASPNLRVSQGSIPSQHRSTGATGDRRTNGEDVQLLRHCAGCRTTSSSGQQRRRTRLPDPKPRPGIQPLRPGR